MNSIPDYSIIFHQSHKDGVVVAEVPELPGCMADGVTYEEAAVNVRIVIAEWVETAKELDRAIPEPRGRQA